MIKDNEKSKIKGRLTNSKHRNIFEAISSFRHDACLEFYNTFSKQTIKATFFVLSTTIDATTFEVH